MKATPVIRTLDSTARSVSRADAAASIRHERRAGTIHRIAGGYVLVSRNAFIKTQKPPKPEPPPLSRPLCVRLTHSYSTGYSSLDRWQEIGQCRVVRLGQRRESMDSYCRIAIVEIDATTARHRPGNVGRAIHDTFTSGCRCEHDCCGHYQHSVRRVRRLSATRYAAILCAHRNV